MAYSVQYDENENLVLITMNGEINQASARMAIQQAMKTIQEHHCFFTISDFRNANLVLNTFELVNLQDFWISSFNAISMPSYTARRAFLLNPNQNTLERLRFFETLSVNRNQPVKLFFDQDEAIAWLKKSPVCQLV